MKRLLSILLLVPLLIGLVTASPAGVLAQHASPIGKIDLIIQTNGSPEVLADQIRSLNGNVNYIFRNVPGVAASVPFDRIGAVSSLPGVSSVQKDLPIRLPEGKFTNLSGNRTAKPWTFPVQTSGVVRALPASLPQAPVDNQSQGIANFMYTGADQIWQETGRGAGSVVAVVDTGVARNSCLQHAVIGAPGYPEGFNSTEDGIPATDFNNAPHGTWVAGIIAGNCILDFSANPDDPLYQAILTYMHWPPDFVPMLGQAPQAQIYPVKVFDTTGGGSWWTVLAGLDHILSLKRDGLLDIDIINMSLAFPALYDEHDIFEEMVDQLTEAGILVVSAAANEGAIPNSVMTPASTNGSLAAGGLDYAPTTRVFFELLGLYFGPNWIPLDGDEVAGMGMVMRPTDETRVIDFSSRGPLSNGQFAPDLTALAYVPLVINPFDQIDYDSGTSFASPTIAGVAALLNAYRENVQGQDIDAIALRNALFKGADLEAVGDLWRGINDTGYGAVDAVRALDLLKSGKLKLKYPVKVGQLKANILGGAKKGKSETYQSEEVTLQPLETFNSIFEISQFTSKVTIEVYDMVIPDNSNRAAWPNALHLSVQSAKHGMWHPVDEYRDYSHEDVLTLEINDGPWLLNGEEMFYWPMEPGLMKVTLLGDVQNEVPVSFKLRISRDNYMPKLTGKIFESEIRFDQMIEIPVIIPEGISQATFDVVFNRDWSKFPTSDIDMAPADPEGNITVWDGTSYNAPERAVVNNPAPGLWTVFVYGYELYKPDHFTLYLNTVSNETPSSP